MGEAYFKSSGWTSVLGGAFELTYRMVINLFHMQSRWNLPMEESASAKVLGWERDQVSWVLKEVAVSRVCWALGEAAPGW